MSFWFEFADAWELRKLSSQGFFRKEVSSILKPLTNATSRFVSTALHLSSIWNNVHGFTPSWSIFQFQKYGHGLEKAIKKETSGDYKDMMLYIGE